MSFDVENDSMEISKSDFEIMCDEIKSLTKENLELFTALDLLYRFVENSKVKLPKENSVTIFINSVLTIARAKHESRI